MKSNLLQLVLSLLVILLLAAACRQQGTSADNIALDISVSDQLVGETTLLVKVTDSEGNAIENPGVLSIRGDMNHAGMVPVFADSSESVKGVFTLPFEWTMGGSWILEVSLTLDSGEVYRQSFDYEISGAAGMAAMDHSRIFAETTALYMRITNRGADDVTITAAETQAANQVEFHETIVENGVARMEALDSLVIPAGETLELRPGGKHIMLSQLTADIMPNSRLAFRLTLDSGERIDLTAAVLDMLMGALEDDMEVGSLTFSQMWLRPASASDMTAMNHASMNMHMEETPSG